MCGVVFAFWAGRHNNVAIEERSDVRRQAINTRVVELPPMVAESAKGTVNEGKGPHLDRSKYIYSHCIHLENRHNSSIDLSITPNPSQNEFLRTDLCLEHTCPCFRICLQVQ